MQPTIATSATVPALALPKWPSPTGHVSPSAPMALSPRSASPLPRTVSPFAGRPVSLPLHTTLVPTHLLHGGSMQLPPQGPISPSTNFRSVSPGRWSPSASPARTRGPAPFAAMPAVAFRSSSPVRAPAAATAAVPAFAFNPSPRPSVASPGTSPQVLHRQVVGAYAPQVQRVPAVALPQRHPMSGSANVPAGHARISTAHSLSAQTPAPSARSGNLSASGDAFRSMISDGRSSEKDILAHCQNTDKLVKQLAAALKGLEADVEGLRKENKTLRETVARGGSTQESPDDRQSQLASQPQPETQPTPLTQPIPLEQPQQPPQAQRPPSPPAQAPTTAVSALPAHQLAKPQRNRPTPVPLQMDDLQAGSRNASVANRSSPVGSRASPTGNLSNGGSPSARASRPDMDSTATILAPQGVALPEDAQAGVLSPRGSSSRGGAPQVSVYVESSESPRGLEQAGQSRNDFGMQDSPKSPRIKSTIEAVDRSAVLSRNATPPPVPVPLAATAVAAPQSNQASAALLPSAPVGGVAPAAVAPSVAQVEERLEMGDVDGAQELLRTLLRDGIEPTEAVFDALVGALRQRGQMDKAEAWVENALDLGLSPSEPSLETAMTAAVRKGNPTYVENFMAKLMRRKAPPKSVFNIVIRMFVELRDAMKVEQWLLKAGQSGWTPEQGAFDAVVLLFSDTDAVKAEEWLSRALRTDYRLPDACFEAVVRAFLRNRDVAKANEWLSRAHADKRLPSDATLREAASLSMEAGSLVHAEAWMTFLVAHGDSSVDGLRRELFDASLQVGDTACAERQLTALGGPEPDRTQRLVVAYAEQGQAARSKAVLERYCALGGLLTPEISSSVLSACATVGDAEGTEAAARALAASATGNGPPLNSAQVAMLRRALGDERAIGLLAELGYHPDTAEFGAGMDEGPYDSLDVGGLQGEDGPARARNTSQQATSVHERTRVTSGAGDRAGLNGSRLAGSQAGASKLRKPAPRSLGGSTAGSGVSPRTSGASGAGRGRTNLAASNKARSLVDSNLRRAA